MAMDTALMCARQEGPGGAKQPYYINWGEDHLMPMAGLFDVWSQGGGQLLTCTILTTDSSKRLQW